MSPETFICPIHGIQQPYGEPCILCYLDNIDFAPYKNHQEFRQKLSEAIQGIINKNTVVTQVYLHARCPACGQCHTLIQILNSALVRCPTCEYEGPMIKEPEG